MLSIKLIKKAFSPIEKNEYKKIFLIFLLTLITSLTEVISVGVVIPILNLFVEDDYLNYLNYFQFLNFEEKNQILIFILFLFFLAHLAKFFLNRYLIIIQNKFSHNLYVKISKTLFQDYLSKDYTFFVNKNSAELIRNIISEANLFSFGVIFHLIRLFSELIIFTSLGVLLIYINYKISLLTLGFFSITSYIYYKIYSLSLKKLGEKRQFHSQKVIKQLQESFDGFRELILNKLQLIFYKNFYIHTRANADVGIKKDIIVQMPRLILELLTISSLVLIVIFLIYEDYTISQIFILLGVFLYTTIRILPSVSKIIQSIQSINFNETVVELISNQIKNKKLNKIDDGKNYNKAEFKFKKIKLNDINFYYKKNNHILKNVNLDINFGEKIGLIGKSGSGKSTLINIICGLLKPLNGDLKIDDQDLKNNIRTYQNQIGYVPQNVTIFDESVIFNIALEFDESKINIDRVNKILKELELYEVIDKLPNKLYEIVGEKGAKLSGGQCQRLGIARILYRNPSIIILDEATSALDSNIEGKILHSLFEKHKECTILLSTHRQQPLKYCDMIYELKDQKLNNTEYE